ncbi:hypothetical protein [Rhizobium leguminosarum]|uniref:hypothetical protein n=1 Tax=Rhizobium leguminosarum TaxID=384 RepID=UPI0021BBED18|nr:hypothetical protein [Rhizobium leguminosarum]
MVILVSQRLSNPLKRRSSAAGAFPGTRQSAAKARRLILKLVSRLLRAGGGRRQSIQVGSRRRGLRTIDFEPKCCLSHYWSLPFIRENGIEKATAKRTVRNHLFRLFLIGGLPRHDFSALQVHGDDGVQLPLLKCDATQTRPFPDGLEPDGIGTETIPGALAIELTKPIPNLLTGNRDGYLLAVVLIFNQSAEAGGELLVKELRRTARTSTCSRMMRNLE